MLRYLYHSQLCTRKALDMLQSHSQYRFLFLTITPYNQVLDKWQQILLPAGIMYLVNAALNFFSKSSTLAHNNTPPPPQHTQNTRTQKQKWRENNTDAYPTYLQSAKLENIWANWLEVIHYIHIRLLGKFILFQGVKLETIKPINSRYITFTFQLLGN